MHVTAVPLGNLEGSAGPGPVPRLLDRTTASVRVTGVTLDSRQVRPGDLYAALPGANAHGADFASGAISAGAVAVLTDPTGATRLQDAGVRIPLLVADDPRGCLGMVSAVVYGEPAVALTLVGITGTNGKTTTAYILDAALRALGRRTGLIGTVETRIADRRVESVRTTPESCDLHGLFAMMREDDVEVCTMEVSSHALALNRVEAARFNAVAFTNLSQDHLDFHRTMEDYFQAKASLFDPQRAERGVVVVDDAWGVRLAAEAAIPVTTLASRTGPASAEAAEAVAADWYLDGHPGDRHFRLVPSTLPHRPLELASVLPGDFNRVNTAVAALLLLALDVGPDEVERALLADPRVPGRMERVDLGLGAPAVYVDFAHTPEAIRATVRALRAGSPQRRLVAVLGAGGSRDPGKRPDMGRAAAQSADVVIVTDDNPRCEDPAAIRAAVLSGARDAGAHRPGPDVEVWEIPSRATAVARALELAEPGGVVALLGKGHERGQEISGTTYPFDDREAVRNAWKARR